jgi:hypothetical protein
MKVRELKEATRLKSSASDLAMMDHPNQNKGATLT